MKDFLYTIILLGFIQGIIIACLLYFSSGQKMQNRILAAIILLITLPGIHLYFHYKNWFDVNAAGLFLHDLIPFVVIMPLGPLIYFYIRSMLDPGFRPGRKERLYFLPVIIDLLPKAAAVIFYAGKMTGWPGWNRNQLAAMVDTYSQYADLPRWLSLTIYLVLSVRWMKRYYLGAPANATASLTRRWLRLFTRLFLAFQAIWLLYLIPYIIPHYSGKLLDTVDWFPVYIPMAILIYWLGIRGWLISQEMDRATKKSKKQQYTGQEFSDSLHLLKRSMEENLLYLDPELNLEKLSRHAGLHPKNISAMLNQHPGMGFNHFVNQYRVEEFKRRLSAAGDRQLTIAGLATECGFNSVASFQRIFKQATGFSPSEFKKTLERTAETG